MLSKVEELLLLCCKIFKTSNSYTKIDRNYCVTQVVFSFMVELVVKIPKSTLIVLKIWIYQQNSKGSKDAVTPRRRKGFFSVVIFTMVATCQNLLGNWSIAYHLLNPSGGVLVTSLQLFFLTWSK